MSTIRNETRRPRPQHPPETTGAAPRPRDPARPEVDRRLEYLAEASRLLANSLEYETTLATVARLALPDLGAWCIVDLVEESGEMRRLAVVHPVPEQQALACRLESGWPPERDDPLGVPRAMRTRRPELVPRVTDELLARAARNGENLRLLRELGIHSFIVVPLIARDHVLGAMTYVSATGGPGYTEEDLTFAEDLAGRCAIAIDNARLYRRAEQARAQAEAARTETQAASLAKSQFLAMVSHEIRTPINAIVGYTELLLMELDGALTPEQRGKLERIQASSRHLLGLINQLLDLAKVEAQQMTVQRERARAADAVEAAVQIVFPLALEHALDVQDACPDEELSYLGDPDRVRQILVNLLTNAAKFTAAGGRITVRCDLAAHADPEARVSGAGPWVRMEVEDTGVGIPESGLQAVFEPFVQLSAGLTRSEGGTGLGLAISRELARMMGGDLTVRSRVGKGSVFTLWLPAAPSGGARGAGEESRLFRRDTDRLSALGALLLERSGAILNRYVRRLRSDPRVPLGDRSTDVELRAHALNFLTGVAESLSMAREAGGGVTRTLRDGSRIQRVISELHGAQRHGLGWSEDALQRDFELLREAAEEEVRGSRPDDPEIEEGLEVVGRIFAHATRVALQGWRLAEAREQQRSGALPA